MGVVHHKDGELSVVTMKLQDAVNDIVNWSRKSALWPMTFGLVRVFFGPLPDSLI